MVEPYKTAP